MFSRFLPSILSNDDCQWSFINFLSPGIIQAPSLSSFYLHLWLWVNPLLPIHLWRHSTSVSVYLSISMPGYHYWTAVSGCISVDCCPSISSCNSTLVAGYQLTAIPGYCFSPILFYRHAAIRVFQLFSGYQSVPGSYSFSYNGNHSFSISVSFFPYPCPSVNLHLWQSVNHWLSRSVCDNHSIPFAGFHSISFSGHLFSSIPVFRCMSSSGRHSIIGYLANSGHFSATLNCYQSSPISGYQCSSNLVYHRIAICDFKKLLVIILLLVISQYPYLVFFHYPTVNIIFL